MDSWRTADDPACPACGEPLAPTAMECPHCDEQFLSEEEAEALAEHLAEALDAEPRGAPRWAVLLTGLALGIAIAPLVTYAGVIATGARSLGVVATLLLAGWLLPGLYLARFRNPSEVLSRGLYLVVAGIGAVVVAVGYDTFSAGTSTVSGGRRCSWHSSPFPQWSLRCWPDGPRTARLASSAASPADSTSGPASTTRSDYPSVPAPSGTNRPAIQPTTAAITAGTPAINSRTRKRLPRSARPPSTATSGLSATTGTNNRTTATA
ncbi:hypothetical protein ACFQL1_17540 [Halomicroarcula sp. GCM10025709]|uniref:hypothetical protein n=1 Tax=Halomicroarcula sp. GCM10025709 TaxID=3252669 RepID=UPI00362090DB